MPEHPSSTTPADPTAGHPGDHRDTPVAPVAPVTAPVERSPFDLHSPADWLRWIGRSSKRLAVLVVGVAIVGAGVAMLALPGPGVLVVVVGLAVLATEFAWAERALDRTTAKAASAATKVSASRSGRLALVASGIGMVVGGATVVALVGSYRLVGASVALAGLIGLGTLHPRVQRWLDGRAAPAVIPAGSRPELPLAAAPVPVASPTAPSTSSSTHHPNGDRS